MYWKHQIGEGVCDLEIQKQQEGDEVPSLLAVSPKGKYHLFQSRNIQGTALPLIASMKSSIHPKTSSTLWCGSFCPFTANHFMLTTNDGFLSLHKQYVICSFYIRNKIVMTLHHRSITKEEELVTTEDICDMRVSDCGILSFQWHTEKKGLFLYSCLDKTTSVGFVDLGK